MPTIYWQRNGSMLKFSISGYYERAFWYYTFREAYRRYKQEFGIKKAHTQQVDWLIDNL